jgi:phosphoglucosamine mutase
LTLRFGTDGVRGVANLELTPELVLALGRAAARTLRGDPWVVGRDTRASGPMLQAAFSAGLLAEGVHQVIDAGVIPTPGVAFLSADNDMPGAMVSASHNPYQDNGVKLFAAGGRKLTDAEEERLEAELDGAPGTAPPVGEVFVPRRIVDRYVDHVVGTVEGRRLEGVRVVIDCAHGAASEVAGLLFHTLGAWARTLGAQPTGTNINEGCGSTHPEMLQAAVVADDADLGLAFDGDADRVVAVDHRGRVVDGDHLLALFALDLRERGLLEGDTVVVTVMTNLGFRLAMADHGIRVHETQVGDRYVLEALAANGWSLGGEQSGHIVFHDLATTGDGLLTGLQLVDLVRRSGRSLAELADGAMTRLPQVLRNVPVGDREAVAQAGPVWDEVAAVEAELGAQGRVLLRASGTEPVVRVMVEAPTPEQAEAVADRLAEAVARACAP